jgi:hypothetical protein
MGLDHFLAIFSIKNQELFILITFFNYSYHWLFYFYKFHSFSSITYHVIFQIKIKKFQKRYQIKNLRICFHFIFEGKKIQWEKKILRIFYKIC